MKCWMVGTPSWFVVIDAYDWIISCEEGVGNGPPAEKESLFNKDNYYDRLRIVIGCSPVNQKSKKTIKLIKSGG